MDPDAARAAASNIDTSASNIRRHHLDTKISTLASALPSSPMVTIVRSTDVNDYTIRPQFPAWSANPGK